MRLYYAVMFAAALLASGCTHARSAWRERPGSALARGAYYTDNSGISVASMSATGEQPVARRMTVTARALVDDITVRRKPLDPGDPGAEQPTGHPPHDPDAVTSASSTAGGGSVAEKQRWEGLARVELRSAGMHTPWWLWLSGRASTEPDYGSMSAALGGTVELFQRNTAVSGSLGYGQDTVSPVEAPPGQDEMWPAEHERVAASISATQILSRSMLVSAGGAATFQLGQLANPYRRALVRTSLFPEVVPDRRDRLTAFVGLAWHLGLRTALHLRQGMYADSWDVRAWIPEAALAVELGESTLLTGHYRYYRQSAAYFYEARYQDLEPLMSGDPRAGAIRAHALGLDLRVVPLGERFDGGGLSLDAGYEVQTLDYLAYATELIVGHTLSLSLTGWY